MRTNMRAEVPLLGVGMKGQKSEEENESRKSSPEGRNGELARRRGKREEKIAVSQGARGQGLKGGIVPAVKAMLCQEIKIVDGRFEMKRGFCES